MVSYSCKDNDVIMANINITDSPGTMVRARVHELVLVTLTVSARRLKSSC
jgi:hypothetical protein